MSVQHSSPPKKVLHVTFDMRIGGTEMVIKNIIEGNTNDNVEMSIFCVEEPIGPWGIDLQSKGITLNSVARKDGFDFTVVKALRKHIKTQNIQVLHCHQYTPWVYATIASLGTGAKIIFTEHGRFYPDYSSWKRRYINPLLALFTDKITAISKATKQALVDYEFLNEAKISVIYNGIEKLKEDPMQAEAIRTKLNVSENDIVYGTIARLDPIKNHTMMMKAFARTHKMLPTSKLIIVGDGELMEELVALRTQLKLESAIIFTGYIPYPKDYLAIFDIFLLSSLSEGTSMTLLEAMSLGKPCIVTDAGGNKEIVEHETTGLVTPNDNEAAFAEAMIKAGENEQLRERFSGQALMRFEELFDVANMSREYDECYGEIGIHALGVNQNA